MRIAIVDDMSQDRSHIREQLETELKERGVTAAIHEYESGEAFLEEFTPGMFSIVFLDIYMEKVNGVEVARELYRWDSDCRIIFLTSSEEYLRESYSVRATYYLIKPYEPKELRQALDFCFPKSKPADVLSVRTREGMRIIPREEILYIEIKGRHPHIHLAGNSIECLDNLTEVVRPLAQDRRFFGCCRGIVINLGKVVTQKDNDFIMDNGHQVPISRRIKPEALRAFHSYMFGITSRGDYENEN